MRGLSLFDAPFIASGFTRAGLKGWWSADSLALANNALVSSLTDLSGNGNTFVQATGASQPVFNTAQQNGLPGLTFDGARFMTAPAITSGANFTMFAVHKNTSAASAVRGMIHVGLGNGYSFNTTTFSSRLMQARAAGDLNDGPFTLVTELWTGQRTSSGPLWTFYVNTVNQVITNSTIGMTNPTTSSTLGKFEDGIGGFGWVGSVFEILIYDSVLTASERAGVEAYLNGKWAIY